MAEKKLGRKIIHIDMDYFFAQVEERDNPSLKNKPVAIGGKEHERGVLSTCNYIARKHGLHSAMPTATALRKCPNLILLPANMEKYKTASNIIRSIFHSVTPLVEPLSLDEAYLDVTDVGFYNNNATQIAQAIKRKIYLKTQLTASAGVAPNKLLAKIASDINKPNGLTLVKPHQINEFIGQMPIKKIFGVGKVTQEKLKNMNIEFCHQLQPCSLETLVKQFGKFGASLHNYCRGIDHREVNPNRIRKSISVENTFMKDLSTHSECLEKLPKIHAELIKRIKKNNIQSISGIFIKITDSQFNKSTIERQSKSLNIELFQILLNDIIKKQQNSIRLIGIGAKISEANQKQFDLLL